MTVEEMRAIEHVREDLDFKIVKYGIEVLNDLGCYVNEDIKIILELIEKQEIEIEELKIDKNQNENCITECIKILLAYDISKQGIDLTKVEKHIDVPKSIKCIYKKIEETKSKLDKILKSESEV